MVVTTLTGKELVLGVDRSKPIIVLKELIQGTEGTPADRQRLVNRGRELGDNLTFAYYKIHDGAKIEIHENPRWSEVADTCGEGASGAGGACTKQFADVSDTSGLTDDKFLDHAPDWRIAEPGLCLEGECTNRRCKAHGEMVILNHGFLDFDLMQAGEKKRVAQKGLDESNIATKEATKAAFEAIDHIEELLKGKQEKIIKEIPKIRPKNFYQPPHRK